MNSPRVLQKESYVITQILTLLLRTVITLGYCVIDALLCDCHQLYAVLHFIKDLFLKRGCATRPLLVEYLTTSIRDKKEKERSLSHYHYYQSLRCIISRRCKENSLA